MKANDVGLQENDDKNFKSNVDIILDSCYAICRDCAEINGAKMPEEHIASFWTSKCDVCKNTNCVASTKDWNWRK